MKLCNETITVFNARVDPGTGGKVWIPTVISGVSWFATDATAVDGAKGGLVAASKVIVRIPGDADAGGRAYVDPLTYTNAESAEGLWTLANGDIVVKGEVSDATVEDTSSAPQSGAPSPQGEGFWTPAALKKAFSDCAAVLAVTDNRRAPNAGHWRVVGA